MFEIVPPHRNLGCLGLKLGERYVGDVSLPNREGFGWSWLRLVRIYWKSSEGRRHLLYLPTFEYYAHRSE